MANRKGFTAQGTVPRATSIEKEKKVISAHQSGRSRFDPRTTNAGRQTFLGFGFEDWADHFQSSNVGT